MSNQMIRFDGFDDCIAGLGYDHTGDDRIVYSKEKIIRKLMKSNGDDFMEALEHFEHNMLNLCSSRATAPIFLMEGEL